MDIYHIYTCVYIRWIYIHTHIYPIYIYISIQWNIFSLRKEGILTHPTTWMNLVDIL